MNLTYEGLVDKFRRTHLSKDLDSLQPHVRRVVERVVTSQACPDCRGSRYSAAVLDCRIDGRNIADCAAMQVTELIAFLRSLDEPTVAPVLPRCWTGSSRWPSSGWATCRWTGPARRCPAARRSG
jgi:excinuclease UvrABC ATPase subunit